MQTTSKFLSIITREIIDESEVARIKSSLPENQKENLTFAN